MRETIARAVCLLTLAVVVALAHLFAERHNSRVPVTSPVKQQQPVARPELSDHALRGQQVYKLQGCESCHAIAGVGNPRNPLDGVAARRSAGELREWMTGTGPAIEQLSPAVVKRKQRYQELPEADVKALLDYLGTLTETVKGP